MGARRDDYRHLASPVNGAADRLASRGASGACEALRVPGCHRGSVIPEALRGALRARNGLPAARAGPQHTQAPASASGLLDRRPADVARRCQA